MVRVSVITAMYGNWKGMRYVKTGKNRVITHQKLHSELSG